jgi:SPP1 family predicted phage head-tail adaptor
MMLAFRMRHRVDIQEPIYTVDENTGAREITWQSILKNVLEPAAINPLSGREFLAAQAVQSNVNTRIIVREQRISPDMRIVHNGRIYNIKAVLPDPTLQKHINLMCETGANDG